MTFASSLRLGLLSIALLLLAWLVWRPPTAIVATGESLPNAFIGQPDLYMLDAQITQYSDNGTLKYVLESEHVRHFESAGMTRLMDPVLLLQGDAQAPWQVMAKQGFIRREPSPGGNIEEVVYLREDVSLHQRLPSGRFLKLKTPTLYVYPDRQFAQTNDSVMIDTDGGRTTGTGLAVNMADSTLKVDSDPPGRVQTIILIDQFK
jgi:lipopolysaccharide export system protein LptC